MKRPRNGQIVLFMPPKCSCGIVDMGQPLAAIITHVWSDRLVTVTAFDAEGSPWSQRNIQLLQDDDKPGNGAHCYFHPEDLDPEPAAEDEYLDDEVIA